MDRLSAATDTSTDVPAWEERETWFRQIFDHDARFVWRALLGLGVPEKDAEDASQQVFVVLHRKLDMLEPMVPVRTFLYGICLRVASEFRRHRRSQRECLVADLPDQAMTATQETSALHREALQQLQDTLDELDDPKRHVFVLYEIEGLEMPEVAAAIGCPLQTAYSRLHAARKAILDSYEDRRSGRSRGSRKHR